jgi:hypothetical protein
MYFGAISGGGGALRRQSGGVAAFAAGVRKDALDKLAAILDARETADKFLRAVLKHYKVNRDTVYAKALLHCRARLFHRVGKMLQAWPKSAVELATSLAKVEGQYAQELVGCSAFVQAPGALHAPPALVKTKISPPGTAEAKAKPKKVSQSKSSPQLLVEDDHQIPAAGDLHQTASAPLAAAAALAYVLPMTDMVRVAAATWDAYPQTLWRRLAMHAPCNCT